MLPAGDEGRSAFLQEVKMTAASIIDAEAFLKRLIVFMDLDFWLKK
jgi:hypothetical protein